MTINYIRKFPVVGFVRYSQKVKFGSSTHEKNVFEPNYFDYRFQIFKNVTLKCFQEQTDLDFCLLLLHSESMPQKYRERFTLLEERTPFLYNIFVPDDWKGFEKELSNSINYVSFENNVAINFRIDNDDAVPQNFIDNLKKYLNPKYAGSVLSAPDILIVKRKSNHKYCIEEKYFPLNSIGLAYVTDKENYNTVMNLGVHVNINKEKTLLISEHIGLQTINGYNEANRINEEKAFVFTRDQVKKYLEEKNFPEIDLRCLNIVKNKGKYKKIILSFIPQSTKKLIKKLLYPSK